MISGMLFSSSSTSSPPRKDRSCYWCSRCVLQNKTIQTAGESVWKIDVKIVIGSIQTVVLEGKNRAWRWWWGNEKQLTIKHRESSFCCFCLLPGETKMGWCRKWESVQVICWFEDDDVAQVTAFSNYSFFLVEKSEDELNQMFDPLSPLVSDVSS